ncbi:hypothetical protein NKJ48_26155 [Mesorhizobium sp. M0114]
MGVRMLRGTTLNAIEERSGGVTMTFAKAGKEREGEAPYLVGADDGLIAGLADFLDKHQATPRSERRKRPVARLGDLLTAYLRVAGDRTASKLHRDLPAQRA